MPDQNAAEQFAAAVSELFASLEAQDTQPASSNQDTADDLMAAIAADNERNSQ